jgi:hypothetical protein
MMDKIILDILHGGDTLAFDDIDGRKYERDKIVLGIIGVNAGDVSSVNPMPAFSSPLTTFET